MLPAPAGGTQEVVHQHACIAYEREDQIPKYEREKYEPEPVVVKISEGKLSLSFTGNILEMPSFS